MMMMMIMILKSEECKISKSEECKISKSEECKISKSEECKISLIDFARVTEECSVNWLC